MTERKNVLKEKVIKLISDYTGIEINENKTLVENGCDSLDEIEIIMMLEEEFECEISDEVADDALQYHVNEFVEKIRAELE